MTVRTEFQHRRAEMKSVFMTWVANKLFSFKEHGIDGWLKGRFLKPARKPTPSDEPSVSRQDQR